MKYVDVKTKQVKTLMDLRKDNPTVSFPQSGPSSSWLADNGLSILMEAPKPEVDDGQKVVGTGNATNIDGQWYTVWNIVNKSQDELDKDKAQSDQDANRLLLSDPIAIIYAILDENPDIAPNVKALMDKEKKRNAIK